MDSGGDLRIIGDESSDAVFCTMNKTYSIKKVETSNAVCLVPPIDKSDDPVFFIEVIKQDYYEVKLYFLPNFALIENIDS